MRNHTDGAPACRRTGVDEGRLAAFEYQPLKGKTKTPLDDSRRAGDQPVGRAAMAAAAEPPGQRLHFLEAFFEVDPT